MLLVCFINFLLNYFFFLGYWTFKIPLHYKTVESRKGELVLKGVWKIFVLMCSMGVSSVQI